MTQRLPHQETAFQKYKDSNNIAVFWTMGRGKTKLAIDIAEHKYRQGDIDRVVIIAPNTVHTQWITEELPKHATLLGATFAYSSNTTKKFIRALDNFLFSCDHTAGLRWLAIHIDALITERIDSVLKRFVVPGRTLWIVDEASRIKNFKAKRTAKAIKLHKQFGGPAMILTGTALAKRPSDVWAMCEFLDHKLLNQNFTSFEAQYSVLIKNTYEVNIKGGAGKKMVEVEGPINDIQWNRVLNSVCSLMAQGHSEAYSISYTASKYKMKPYDVQYVYETKNFTPFRYIDKLKERMAPFATFVEPKDDIQLPEKVYRTIYFDLEPEKVKLLTELRKYAVTVYNDEVMTLSNKAALHTKALQICGGNFAPVDSEGPAQPIKCANRKLTYILDTLDELGDLQFLVFAVFTAEIEALYEALSKQVTCATLYGKTPKEARDQIIDAFKAGKTQCIICNPSVAGYGLNLQNASVQIWYSRGYANEDRIQAEGRSHRFGITESPVYIDLVYDCNFEKKVLEANKMGTSMNTYFNSTSLDKLLEL